MDGRAGKMRISLYLNFGKPVYVCPKYIAAQRITDEFPLANGGDQACRFQFFHVMGESSCADTETVAHLAAR